MKNKAGGVDNINTKILKTLVNYIIIPLEHIFNISIKKSISLDNLKSAKVIPIHKAESNQVFQTIGLFRNAVNYCDKHAVGVRNQCQCH